MKGCRSREEVPAGCIEQKKWLYFVRGSEVVGCVRCYCGGLESWDDCKSDGSLTGEERLLGGLAWSIGATWSLIGWVGEV